MDINEHRKTAHKFPKNTWNIHVYFFSPCSHCHVLDTKYTTLIPPRKKKATIKNTKIQR